MLYQLSYASEEPMERETRIELATNSLEGCDSTIELLPRPFLFYTRGSLIESHGRLASEGLPSAEKFESSKKVVSTVQAERAD